MLAPLLGGEEGKKKERERERDRTSACFHGKTTLFALFYLRSCPFLTPRRYVKHEAFSFVWIHCLSFFFFLTFCSNTHTHTNTPGHVLIFKKGKARLFHVSCALILRSSLVYKKKKKSKKKTHARAQKYSEKLQP